MRAFVGSCAFRERSLVLRVTVRMRVRVRLGRVIDGALDEIADVSIGKRVEDVLACTPARDDALRSKQPELLRDGGEPDACGFGQLRHAPFAVAQPIEQLEARDVSRCTEDRRRTLELVVAQRARARASSVLFRSTNLRRSSPCRSTRNAVGLRGRGRATHHFTI